MDKLTVVDIPRQNRTEHQGELDPCIAYIRDYRVGQGELTLVCWGRAWSHCWGALGNRDLRGFILSCSTGYLVGKLMLPYDVMLKRSEKREERWLTQIVEALKVQLKVQP
jgi:hypothetical protein